MIVLVASENVGTGKTTLVTNLAVLFETRGVQAIIVDATQNHVAAKWMEERNKMEVDCFDDTDTGFYGDSKSPFKIKCIPKCNDLYEEIKDLNTMVCPGSRGTVVIVDCQSGTSEFEEGLSVADMVIVPFRPLKKDFDTLSNVDKKIKKAKECNPELITIAVMMMYPTDKRMSKTDFNQTKIKKIFAKYADTVTQIIKPIIYERDAYKLALNEGDSAMHMRESDPDALAYWEVQNLNSALVKIYKNRNKILPIPLEASETNEEGSNQEQGLETVSSKNGNSVPILNQATRIADKTTKKLSKEAIDALATQYLNKHNEIEKLITDVNEALDFSNEALDLSDTNLLNLGDGLARIFENIQTDDKQSAKKIFVALKKQTAEKVNAFDVNTINKVVKVACNKVISQYRDEKKLPNRWGTLYLLTSLNNEKIHELIASNKITVDTTRKQLKQIVDGIKAKKSKTTTIKRLTIKRKDDKEVTEEEKNELVQILQKNGWVLHEPKTEMSAETNVE